MRLLDTAVVVGVLMVGTKLADLLLRPHQQQKLQRLLETATLALSYTSVLGALKRMADHHFWRLVLVVALMMPIPFVAGLPLLQAMFERSSATPEVVGRVILLVMVVLLLSSVPSALALRWIVRSRSGAGLAVRFGLGLLFLYAANRIADLVLADRIKMGARVLERLLGLVWLFLGSLAAGITMVAWLFVLAMIAHFVLRLIEALAWRVVEYQRGAWAAVIAVATTVLGLADLYLKYR
jgi:hypothetical protein